MKMWDPNPYSLTPAARVLVRCVNSGTMSQKELDAILQEPEVFCSRLLEAEELNRIKQEINQLSLDLELLKLEKNTADVTHNYYLCQWFAFIQQFMSHLQDVLREQTRFRQRLMKPICQQNLPVQADLHRYVVKLMGMAVEFTENLEEKIKMVHSIPATDELLIKLNDSMTQLLAQVAEVESLMMQVLQQRDQPKDSNENVTERMMNFRGSFIRTSESSDDRHCPVQKQGENHVQAVLTQANVLFVVNSSNS